MKSRVLVFLLAAVTAVPAASVETRLIPPPLTASPSEITAFLSRLSAAPDPSHLGAVTSIIDRSTDSNVLISALRLIPTLVYAGGDPDVAAGPVARVASSARVDAKVRRSAIVALGGIPSHISVEALIRVLESEKDDQLLDKTVSALERVTGKNLGRKPGPWTVWWSMQTKFADDVRADLASGRRSRVLTALSAFAQISVPDSESVSLAMEYVYDEEPTIRQAACRALSQSRVGARPDIAAILKRTAEDDPSAAVRVAATLGLQQDKQHRD